MGCWRNVDASKRGWRCAGKCKEAFEMGRSELKGGALGREIGFYLCF